MCFSLSVLWVSWWLFSHEYLSWRIKTDPGKPLTLALWSWCSSRSWVPRAAAFTCFFPTVWDFCHVFTGFNLTGCFRAVFLLVKCLPRLFCSFSMGMNQLTIIFVIKVGREGWDSLFPLKRAPFSNSFTPAALMISSMQQSWKTRPLLVFLLISSPWH